MGMVGHQKDLDVTANEMEVSRGFDAEEGKTGFILK